MESQKQLEQEIVQVQLNQELSRQRLSEDLLKTEENLAKNVAQILEATAIHRDPSKLKGIIQAEAEQVQTLLNLKLEEYRNLRKSDILSRQTIGYPSNQLY